MIRVTRVLLCRPTHFDVKYIINPHMVPATVDRETALHQWEALAAALKSLDIKVDSIEQQPEVPDMVFATDQGVVLDGCVLLAHFRYPERQAETGYYREWFRSQDFRVKELTNGFSFEGGDAQLMGNRLFVGTGFRADIASCEEVAQLLDIDVIPLRLTDPKFYHLDMCFLPLDARTAFYYPGAFSRSSQTLLRKLIPKLHELTVQEARGYSANSFVSDGHVIIQVGNPTFRRKLERLGKQVIEVDLGEFQKAGGGIHCLVNTLERRDSVNSGR